jgi:methyltransferase (TIGR00027 family)
MTDRGASRTALAVAYVRAAHQVLDGAPRLLDDPVAVRLLGPTVGEQLVENPEYHRRKDQVALRAHILLRSRFAEDRLAEAARGGVRQYVLLGAGFDTFALRQPEWARTLRIFEVDHLGTQGMKREMIANAGIPLPENLSFADVDFEHETLEEGLRRHGVAFDVPTFFSWLGVTMYLTEEAIDAVLRAIASFAKGSEIVLTFAQPPRAVPEAGAAYVEMAEMVRSIGEPWVSFFEPPGIEEKLRKFRFSDVTFLTPEESERQYFRGRTDGLPVPSRTTIVAATV